MKCESSYWLTPVASDKQQAAEEVIQTLVGDSGIYAFGERTRGRRKIKPHDWICFYARRKGVVAHAKVSSFPENRPNEKVRYSEKYCWVFHLAEAVLYFDNPTVIDTEIRQKLDRFKGRDPGKPWAWLVQGTHEISENDFKILTHQANVGSPWD